jgi:hypothetical protein
MLSVADYWVEFDEPVERLTDPAKTFAEDAMRLSATCEDHGIPYQSSANGEPEFPVWLLREFYAANP